MDVDQPALEAAHEVGAEDAHEAGERDDVGRVALDPSASAASKASRRREGAVVDDLGGDAALARERQAGGVGAVAETAAMRASQRSLAQARTIASMFEPRPEMRMTMFFIGAAVYRRDRRKPTIERFCRPPQMSDPSSRRATLPSASAAGAGPAARRRVLSGMRPTGAMHIGHYHGALKNWVRLQDEYECFFFAADWHALTTHYEEREVIESSVYEMVTDWLAAGLDPDKATLFIQSRLPEHAELFTLLAMGTPLGWLERMPTYKDQIEQLKDRDLATYGFLGYPLLQAADILIYKAAYVPVGVDQAPHVEITREVARRFNHLYGREPDFESTSRAALEEAAARTGAKEFEAARHAFRESGDAAALERGRGDRSPRARRSAPSDREHLEGYLRGTGKTILVEPEVLLTETRSSSASTARR